MDMYRALNVDVPLLLVSVLHQAAADVTEENYLNTISDLHRELARTLQTAETTLQTWNREQAVSQAEETLQKLQRLGLLSEQVEPTVVRDHLARDNQRLNQRTGSENLLSAPETGIILFQELAEDLSTPLIQTLLQNGREALKAARFQSGHALTAESWFLFRGSLHYDLLDHFLRERVLLNPDRYLKKNAPIGRITISTFQLLYQVGTDLSEAGPSSDFIFSLNEGLFHYQEIRERLAGLLEELAESLPLLHGSFWQQRGVPGLENTWMLRFRLPVPDPSEDAASPVGKLVNTIEPLIDPEVRTLLTEGRLFSGRGVQL